MITIKIGDFERNFEKVDEIDENWINQQINGLRSDKSFVCVRVSLHSDPIWMSLATPNCASSGGVPRPPTDEEEKIFDLWEKSGLQKSNFHGGNLVAFFKQLRKVMN